MRHVIWAALLTVAAGGTAGAEPVVYAGGQVWTGDGWARRDVAVDGDRIVAAAPAGARRVDVAGRYLTPAYGNAHAHVTDATEKASRFYTDAGVFYVWNPTTVVIGPEQRAFYARPDAYDVKVSQGGITEPGGHPERLYVDFLTQYVYKGRDKAWFVGNAFHYGSTPAEIDAALNRLQAQGAQFVKAYLLRSERYAEAKADSKQYGRRGLDPVNVPYLVAQAHRRGLPVAAHVETAHDLRMAAWAGVDIAAHLPGYGGGTGAQLDAQRLTDADAALVARSGMVVVPTYALVRGDSYGAAGPLKPEARAATAVQADNLKRLRAAGVPVLMGTDGNGPIFGEAEHLVEIGALSHADAAAVTLGTARRMFPERRVGCLDAGCEADFLVLAANPTADIKALRAIERRVMQGRELPGPEAASAGAPASATPPSPAAAVPAASVQRLLGFPLQLSHYDHHWYWWLPRHPIFEAAEVMSAARPGGPLVWVFFTERAGGKRQRHYINDARLATALGWTHRDIRFETKGVGDEARSLAVSLTDAEGRPVELTMGFEPGKRLLRTDNRGLTDQSGHSAETLFMTFYRDTRAMGSRGTVKIGGVDHAFRPDEPLGRYPMRYANGSNIYIGITSYGRQSVPSDATVEARPGGGTIRTRRARSGALSTMTFDAADALVEARQSVGPRAMFTSYSPALAPCSAGTAPATSRFSLSIDSDRDLIVGDATRRCEGGEAIVEYRPSSPGWAAAQPFSVRQSLATDGAGTLLTTRPLPRTPKF